MTTINVLTFDAEKCSGCRQCMLACSLIKEDEFDLTRSRIYIGTGAKGRYDLLACCRCDEFNCGQVCPVEAISRHPATRAPIVDYDQCNSCLLCVDACEYRAVRVSLDDRILICDQCGGDPFCARYCSYGSLNARPVEAGQIKAG